MNKNYVWYACYGSNLLKERFMTYIKGGICRFNGVNYTGCTDKSDPQDDKACLIQYEVYFGKQSKSWDDGGVAFLNPVRNEKAMTLGRMFLITEEQFAEVNNQEGPGWYNNVIDLGEAEGFPVRTFTHSIEFSKNKPSPKYFNVVKEGLAETYPDMTESEILSYLDKCLK